jgi:hypothetical protein
MNPRLALAALLLVCVAVSLPAAPADPYAAGRAAYSQLSEADQKALHRPRPGQKLSPEASAALATIRASLAAGATQPPRPVALLPRLVNAASEAADAQISPLRQTVALAEIRAAQAKLAPSSADRDVAAREILALAATFSSADGLLAVDGRDDLIDTALHQVRARPSLERTPEEVAALIAALRAVPPAPSLADAFASECQRYLTTASDDLQSALEALAVKTGLPPDVPDELRLSGIVVDGTGTTLLLETGSGPLKLSQGQSRDGFTFVAADPHRRQATLLRDGRVITLDLAARTFRQWSPAALEAIARQAPKGSNLAYMLATRRGTVAEFLVDLNRSIKEFPALRSEIAAEAPWLTDESLREKRAATLSPPLAGQLQGLAYALQNQCKTQENLASMIAQLEVAGQKPNP